MPYITYYSEMRKKERIENLEKEAAVQLGRKVTKFVHLPDLKENRQRRAEWRAGVSEALLQADTLYTTLLQSGEPLYHTFKIPKNSGGFREITAPHPALRQAQTLVVKALTHHKKLRVLEHNAAHGFVKRRNTKTALEVHKRNHSCWFVKMDIKDFFPSITDVMLTNMLSNVYPLHWLTTEQMQIITKVCFLDGKLPQGSPASPFLSNIYMLAADHFLTTVVCRNYNLKYTRYADDMLFSSKEAFDYKTVQKAVASTIDTYGLKLNSKKTRYGNNHGSNWNLGLMYNNDQNITVGYKAKRALKHTRHRILTMDGYGTAENILSYNGLLGYYRFIEPEYFKDWEFIQPPQI